MSLIIKFLFFLLKLINSKYISIPFIVQQFNHKKETSLIKNYIYKDILISFLIGTPEQKINISACLGEYTTFIIPIDGIGFEGATYNKNISKSFSSYTEKPDFYLFQLFNKGIHSKDNFIIEKSQIRINNLEFMLAYEVGINICHINYCEVLTQPGILGFLLNERYDEYNTTKLNFMKQLKDKNLISNYDFNFDFETENSGHIIIGEKPHEYDNIHYDEEYFLNNKITIVGNDIDWRYSFDKILYGEQEINNQKAVIFRIEYGLIMGDYPWQKILENNFFNKLINESKCFKETTTEKDNKIMFYYCNKNIDLSEFQPFTFYINEFNFNFTLTKDDLFLEENDKYIFLMVFGKYDLIFGYPFFKKYQLIFNQESKTIGFYREMKNNSSSSSPSNNNINIYYIVIIVLSIILLILIVIFIFCYLKEIKNKKKSAKELSNEKNDNDIIDEKNKKLVEENEIN